MVEGEAAHSPKLQENLNPEKCLTFKLLKLEFLVNTRILEFSFKIALKTIVITKQRYLIMTQFTFLYYTDTANQDDRFRLLHSKTSSGFSYMYYKLFHSTYGRLKSRILTELVTIMDRVK